MERYVIGIGEVLWDCLPEGRKLGGAPANFAYHTAQFGIKTAVVSAVGKDALGNEIIEIFDQKNLKHIMELVDYPTGTVQVKVGTNGVPSYEINENVAWDNIPYSARIADIARNTRVVCFGSLAQRNTVSRETINRFIDAMPSDEETYKVFDINLRQHFYDKETIVHLLNKCNMLKINDDELIILKQLSGCVGADNKEFCKRLLSQYNLKILILTCGTNGSYVFSDDRESFMETPEVVVADTVGAGDSFTAAFIASVLKGKSVIEAHKFAVAVAAYVCTQNGAMPSLPSELVDL